MPRGRFGPAAPVFRRRRLSVGGGAAALRRGGGRRPGAGAGGAGEAGARGQRATRLPVSSGAHIVFVWEEPNLWYATNNMV